LARQSIVVDGFQHSGQPIPAAERVGPLIMTGGVYGLDPATGKIPDDLAEQTRLMFVNLARILEAAGASLADVAKMTVYVRLPAARAAVNVEWLKAFPDETSRPARHTQPAEHLPANMLVQCDATAWVAP
jgi:enamine deaminase RidA (YjgF/YER057c/UK114 family)